MKRLKPEQKLGPSDFAAEIERLKAEGKLPPLERLLSAVAEVREIYRPKILAARNTKSPMTQQESLTTEQLAERVIKDLERMSLEELAVCRKHLVKAFGLHDDDTEHSGVLQFMLKNRIELTLENYIDLSFMGAPPDGIEEDGEFLASVPDVILNGPRLVQ
jgi:hypothetical protein